MQKTDFLHLSNFNENTLQKSNGLRYVGFFLSLSGPKSGRCKNPFFASARVTKALILKAYLHDIGFDTRQGARRDAIFTKNRISHQLGLILTDAR
jgi:hypothetical protein